MRTPPWRTSPITASMPGASRTSPGAASSTSPTRTATPGHCRSCPRVPDARRRRPAVLLTRHRAAGEFVARERVDDAVVGAVTGRPLLAGVRVAEVQLDVLAPDRDPMPVQEGFAEVADLAVQRGRAGEARSYRLGERPRGQQLCDVRRRALDHRVTVRPLRVVGLQAVTVRERPDGL